MQRLSTSALSEIMTLRDALATLEPATTQTEAIDRLRAWEAVKASAEAAQARDAATLEALRIEDETARGVPKARRGKGLSAEVALARGESPARGAKSLKLAGALTRDLPWTLKALQAGLIREEHAHIVSKETSWLSSTHRRAVDELIAPRLGKLGPRQLAAEVRAHAQRLDQAEAVKQLARAASQRGVSVRPAPDNMAYLTALLPMQQAVAIYAALRRDATTMVGTGDTADPADPTSQRRTRDQIMADLLVERATGQTTAPAVPAEVQLVMTDGALFGDDATPAWLTGHGPIPAATAKQWLADPEMQAFLRRVFARPEDHQLVGLESRARAFPAGLCRMIILRDDRCRTPFCDAPIQDIDHAKPARHGGKTSAANASGLCARCNQIKENTGWRHEGDSGSLKVTTPTGHRYTIDTPPLLGRQSPDTRPPPEHGEPHVESNRNKSSTATRKLDTGTYLRSATCFTWRVA